MFNFLALMLCLVGGNALAETAEFEVYGFTAASDLEVEKYCKYFDSDGQCNKDTLGIVQVDLNDDHKKEVVLQVNDGSFCGSVGCQTIFLQDGKSVAKLITHREFHVYQSQNKGYHDLGFYNRRANDVVRWIWNGKEYSPVSKEIIE